MRRRLLGLPLLAAVATGALLSTAETASAIPAFARKYRTSCQTCHVAYPYLTPFGEAFRRNGFSFPEGLDEDYVKSPPVPLGASAYRNVWPDAVYPADIPGLPPLAVVIESEFAWSSAEHATDFTGAGGEVGLLGAGTIGDRIALYAEVEFEQRAGDGEVNLERVYGIYKFDPETPVANLRFGRFEPQILNISNHRRFGPKYLALTEAGGVGDNAWSAEPAQQGFELSGILGGRASYSLGLVEGRGNLGDGAKDGYARLGYKFGGMRPDGVVEDLDSSVANPRPWAERSASLNAFYYRGTASIDEGQPKDRFDVFGGDARLIWDDLIADLGADSRSHSRPLAGSDESRDGWNLWTEADYVLYPWLIPSLRYERSDQDDEDALNRLSVAVNVLLRANVKAKLIYELTGRHGDEDREAEIELAVVIAF